MRCYQVNKAEIMSNKTTNGPWLRRLSNTQQRCRLTSRTYSIANNCRRMQVRYYVRLVQLNSLDADCLSWATPGWRSCNTCIAYNLTSSLIIILGRVVRPMVDIITVQVDNIKMRMGTGAEVDSNSSAAGTLDWRPAKINSNSRTKTQNKCLVNFSKKLLYSYTRL